MTGLTSAHAKDSDVFTPYGAVSYELGKNWSTYVSYAETFTSQANSYTAAGEPLDPAEGQSYEVGLKRRAVRQPGQCFFRGARAIRN